MITAAITSYVKFSGDLNQENAFPSGDLANSPGITNLVELAIGDNVIPVPDVIGFTVHGLVIVPPDVSVEEITLRGDALDTGIVLSSSGVSVLRFGATPPTDITLSVAAVVSGLRLIWF